MTRMKKIIVMRRIGNETITEETRCAEVSVVELEQMLVKVAEGGNETTLRNELIKNSKW